jgi:hypothetical protein
MINLIKVSSRGTEYLLLSRDDTFELSGRWWGGGGFVEAEAEAENHEPSYYITLGPDDFITHIFQSTIHYNQIVRRFKFLNTDSIVD